MVLISSIILAIAGTAAAFWPIPPPRPIRKPEPPRVETNEYQTAVHGIQHLLSRYPVAVDGKKWDDLPSLFFSHAVLNLPAPQGKIRGAANITDAITDDLRLFDSTQHSYGTQHIDLRCESSADVVTYLTASHFRTRTPPGKNEVLHIYGQYKDVVRKMNGKWMIFERTYTLMGPKISHSFHQN